VVQDWLEYLQTFFDKITVAGGHGHSKVGRTQTIFDTGTTLIVGDPARIKSFYLSLRGYGAQLALVQNGISIYTSTWPGSAANQPPQQGLISISQYLETSTHPSPSLPALGKEVEVSPESFNLGPESEGSDTCVAGAASESDESLTGSKLAYDDILP
jgi:hypothetical protein